MKGSCNCGDVSFEIFGDIANLYHCHCKSCQKQSGSTSNTATIVKESNFKWASGLESISYWKKDSGFTSNFCKQCGCPVPNKLREFSLYWIPIGLVEEFDIKITTHICCSSKATWDDIPDNTINYNDMPHDFEGFINSFQGS